MGDRRGRAWLATGVLALLLVPAAALPAPAVPGDFGPGSETLGFDDLAHSMQVDRQYLRSGLVLNGPDGDALVVVDAGDLGGASPSSPPQALEVAPGGSRLRVDFWAPRQRVGFRVGALSAKADVKLQAFAAGDVLLEEIVTNIPAGAAPDVDFFVGLQRGSPEIASVIVELVSSPEALVIDDLIVEPSQESAVDVSAPAAALASPQSTVTDRLDAVTALALQPSVAAATALRGAVAGDPDDGVRERAGNALAQMADRDAIPGLAAAAKGAKPALRMGLLDAVYTLRQLFPHPDLPQVTFVAPGPFLPGQPFIVQAQVTSPAAWSLAEMDLGHAKRWPRYPATLGHSYEGPLAAGQVVQLQGVYVPQKEGYSRIPFRFQADDVPGDEVDFEQFLWVRVGVDGGEAQPTPFADAAGQGEILTLGQ